MARLRNPRVKLIGAVVSWCALVALAAGVGPAAVADPYTPAVPTTCQVAVARLDAGERVVVRVKVTTSGTSAPTGTVTLEVHSAEAWRTSARYTGSETELVGPRLSPGQHRATVVFVPDDAAALVGCQDSADFGVGGVTSENDDAQDSAAQDTRGGLPNTGGPHLVVLLAGVGLVAVGGGLVGRGRRRVHRGAHCA